MVERARDGGPRIDEYSVEVEEDRAQRRHAPRNASSPPSTTSAPSAQRTTGVLMSGTVAWSPPWIRTSIVLPTSPESAPSITPSPPKIAWPGTCQLPVQLGAWWTYFVL